MTLKPGAKRVYIREQILEDKASGLTFKFEKRKSGDFSIDIYGELPFGNRTLIFNNRGDFVGAGTHLSRCPHPSWIKIVD